MLLTPPQQQSPHASCHEQQHAPQHAKHRGLGAIFPLIAPPTAAV